MQKKIVITGGSYAGKTSLINQLGSIGFQTIDETAIVIIEDRVAKMGLDESIAWRKTHYDEFQLMIARAQVRIEQELLSTQDIIFLDRSVVDCIAYCHSENVAVPQEILQMAEETTFHKVFILDTLSSFSERQGSGRTCNLEKSLFIRDELSRVYKQYGYHPVIVPEMSIEKRVNLILDSLI